MAMGSRTHVGQVDEKPNQAEEIQEINKAYYKLTPIHERRSQQKDRSMQRDLSAESSNIAPSECNEISERSSVSVMNTLAKMTAMRAVLVNQTSIYTTSESGKKLFSETSSQ